MATIRPGNMLRVTGVEIQAARLMLALDRSMGTESDPRVVAIANAKRLTPKRRLRPGNILLVTPVEVEAAKLQLALDKSNGVRSDPRVVAISNAKRRTASERNP